MKLFVIIFLNFISFSVVSGQAIPKGIYVGYEINPFCYNDYCKVNHDTITDIKRSSGWYYKVTLQVTDDLSTIEKIPIYMPKNKDSLPQVDSSGLRGYYFYNVIKPSRPNSLTGSLVKCTYCPSCGGTCRYIYSTYSFYQSKQNLLMDSFSEKNILFEKQH